MAKDSFWFKHDCNMRNDTKVLKLRRKLGMEGFGIFNALKEVISGGKCVTVCSIEDLSTELMVDSSLIKYILNGFDLFEIENGIYYYEGAKRLKIFDPNLINNWVEIFDYKVELHKHPALYIFLGELDIFLYVGRSINVRSRLKNNSHVHHRIDWKRLILMYYPNTKGGVNDLYFDEIRVIYSFKPKFNIMHNDG